MPADSVAKATTPQPTGHGGTNWVTRLKPGNTGELPPYTEHIVHALEQRRGMSPSEAYAIAVSAPKRWLHSAHADPGTRAASTIAVGEWEKDKAQNRIGRAAARVPTTASAEMSVVSQMAICEHEDALASTIVNGLTAPVFEAALRRVVFAGDLPLTPRETVLDSLVEQAVIAMTVAEAMRPVPRERSGKWTNYLKKVNSAPGAAPCSNCGALKLPDKMCPSCETAGVGQRASLAEAAVLLVQEGKFSAAKRRELASKGHALPDGSYPIETATDVANAATLARSGHGDVPAAKRLIAKRAKQLGVSNPLAEELRLAVGHEHLPAGHGLHRAAVQPHGGFKVGDRVMWTNPMSQGAAKDLPGNNRPGKVVALHRNGNLHVHDDKDRFGIDVHHTGLKRLREGALTELRREEPKKIKALGSGTVHYAGVLHSGRHIKFAEPADSGEKVTCKTCTAAMRDGKLNEARHPFASVEPHEERAHIEKALSRTHTLTRVPSRYGHGTMLKATPKSERNYTHLTIDGAQGHYHVAKHLHSGTRKEMGIWRTGEFGDLPKQALRENDAPLHGNVAESEAPPRANSHVGTLARAQALRAGETMRLPDGGAIKRHATEDGRDVWSAGASNAWSSSGLSFGDPHRDATAAVKDAFTQSARSTDPASLGGARRFRPYMPVKHAGKTRRFVGVDPATAKPQVRDALGLGQPDSIETVNWGELRPVDDIMRESAAPSIFAAGMDATLQEAARARQGTVAAIIGSGGPADTMDVHRTGGKFTKGRAAIHGAMAKHVKDNPSAHNSGPVAMVATRSRAGGNVHTVKGAGAPIPTGAVHISIPAMQQALPEHEALRRHPTANEHEATRREGKHVAKVAATLALMRGRPVVIHDDPKASA